MELKSPGEAPGGRLPLWSPQNFFLLVLLGTTAWIYSAQSIFVGDTDLWYHLNGGRYIVENGRLPASSYFSFLEPSRPFTDYYWLFQYLIYRLYSVGGYAALMLLRGSLYIAFIFIGSRFFREEWRERGARGFAVNGFILMTLALAAGTRFINLRPHCFSYLLALSFVYILTRSRNHYWLLPVLALLWVNFHGITYPVLLVICLSSLGGLAWKRLRSGPLEKEELRTALALVLSMFAIWATPHGGDLVYVPFRFTKLSNEYINELATRPIGDYFNLHFDSLIPQTNTMFSLYLFCVAVVVFRRGLRLRLDPSHLLMMAGGFIFLTRGVRFSVEFTILTLPLSSMLAPEVFPKEGEGGKRLLKYLLLSALMAAPLVNEATRVLPHRWPYSSAMLPEGTTAFLNEHGGGGKVFNHPNNGGYLQWRLYPRYTIFMDMEIPFMFEDEDIYAVNVVRTSNAAFDRISARYRPEYVIMGLADTDLLARVEKRPEYALVFFDDSTALYANRDLAPKVVEKFALKEVSPVGKHGNSFKSISKERDAELVAAELKRLVELYPGGGLATRWLAQYAYDKEDYEGCLAWAGRFERLYPDSSFVNVIKGDAYRKLKKYEESLDEFRKGLAKAGDAEIAQMKKSMAYTYKAMGDAQKAYGLFSEAVKVIDLETSADDLWQYAMSAYISGKTKEGVELARFAEFKVKAEDKELGGTIRDFLNKVGTEAIQPPKP